MKCPECQIRLPDHALFCLKCGEKLTPGADDTAAEGSIEGERKRLTALFSDLSGYTDMTARLDPEEMIEITAQIFDNVKDIVQKYEGFIERFAGDGVLVLFGVPRAHEDDPMRSIYAAREIHSRCRCTVVSIPALSSQLKLIQKRGPMALPVTQSMSPRG
jgi:class 3 adenylate cyclase